MRPDHGAPDRDALSFDLWQTVKGLVVGHLVQRHGVSIDWCAHARIGIPVTLATLGIVWFWLRWGA